MSTAESIPNFGVRAEAEAMLRRLRDSTARCVFVYKTAAPEYCDFHSHQTMELVHHLGGRGVTRTSQGQEIAYEPLDVVIYPPHLQHDQAAQECGMDLCIHLNLPRGVPGLKRAEYVSPLAVSGLRSDLARLAEYPAAPTEVEQAAFNHAATALLLHLLGAAPSPATTPAERAHAYILAHVERIAGVNDVAAAVSLSPDHLRHLFRTRYGTSIQRVLIEQRIRRAKSLLEHSPLPLKEIARLSGLKNERYFSFRFHQEVGCTPGQFRARGRS